jgi:S-DNA-T family DNA segregation ATPase FtsK/SpoIIIE
VFDARPDARTDEVPLVVASVEPVPAERPRRPVTNEMVALDAFDAFDAVWSTPGGTATGEVESQPPSPLDEASLGSVDASHPWAEDITASPDTSASLLSDASGPQPDAALGRNTPDIAMPAWLTEDIPPQPTPTAQSQPTDVLSVPPSESADAASGWPAIDQGESLGDWADAPSIPSADDVMASEPRAIEALGESIAVPPVPVESTVATPFAADGSTEPRPVVADDPAAATWPAPLLAERAPYVATSAEVAPSVVNAIVSPMVAMAEPISASGLRVSAALSRLAERVRDGEIDVSSVAPEASDAAVLASVLAALLGGSSSR